MPGTNTTTAAKLFAAVCGCPSRAWSVLEQNARIRVVEIVCVLMVVFVTGLYVGSLKSPLDNAGQLAEVQDVIKDGHSYRLGEFRIQVLMDRDTGKRWCVRYPIQAYPDVFDIKNGEVIRTP